MREYIDIINYFLLFCNNIFDFIENKMMMLEYHGIMQVETIETL